MHAPQIAPGSRQAARRSAHQVPAGTTMRSTTLKILEQGADDPIVGREANK